MNIEQAKKIINDDAKYRESECEKEVSALFKKWNCYWHTAGSLMFNGQPYPILITAHKSLTPSIMPTYPTYYKRTFQDMSGPLMPVITTLFKIVDEGQTRAIQSNGAIYTFVGEWPEYEDDIIKDAVEITEAEWEAAKADLIAVAEAGIPA